MTNRRMRPGILLLCLLLVLPFAATAAQSRFVDVEEGEWYSDAVDFVVDRGLFNGVSADEFGIYQSVTRGMFVTVLGRYVEIDMNVYDGNTAFSDVDPNTYYAPHVQWAVEQNIVNGLSADTFGPEQSITREQMATMLARYFSAAGLAFAADRDIIADYTDLNQVEEYALDPLAMMTETGLIQGNDGKFNPKDNATRVEAATIFMRFVELIEAVEAAEIVLPGHSVVLTNLSTERAILSAAGENRRSARFDVAAYTAEGTYDWLSHDTTAVFNRVSPEGTAVVTNVGRRIFSLEMDQPHTVEVSALPAFKKADVAPGATLRITNAGISDSNFYSDAEDGVSYDYTYYTESGALTWCSADKSHGLSFLRIPQGGYGFVTNKSEHTFTVSVPYFLMDLAPDTTPAMMWTTLQPGESCTLNNLTTYRHTTSGFKVEPVEGGGRLYAYTAYNANGSEYWSTAGTNTASPFDFRIPVGGRAVITNVGADPIMVAVATEVLTISR